MLRVLNSIEQYTVSASDGDVGSVADFFLDDERWTIRYLVVETGEFYGDRPVLVSPVSFLRVDWSHRRFHLALTMATVRDSPSVNLHAPVSRRQERAYARQHGYPCYWADRWKDKTPESNPPEPSDEAGSAHLRSAREIGGYRLQGRDELIGNIDGFLVDDETWQVRHVVVVTTHHWFSKRVLIAPQWISSISWADKRASVDISREAVQRCPEWDHRVAITREYEMDLHDFHQRP